MYKEFIFASTYSNTIKIYAIEEDFSQYMRQVLIYGGVMQDAPYQVSLINQGIVGGRWQTHLWLDDVF